MIEQSEQKILQKHLIDFIVEDVFNAVNEDDILEIRKDEKGNRLLDKSRKEIWFLGERRLDDNEINQFRQEARLLQQMKLWKVLEERMKKDAQEKGLILSKTTDDLLASKLLLYLIGFIHKKINEIAV